MMKRLTLPLLFATVLATPLAAQAQRRSPLQDAPAIRKRVELRSTRFELGAGFGSTVNQTFYHGVLANVHAGFHLTDWLSISGMAAFNVASLGTGFRGELLGSLPADPNPDRLRDPTDAQVLSAMNKIGQMFSAQLELTPFTGKYSLFGYLFASYDFYFFAGPAVLSLTAANSGPADPCEANGDPDPAAQPGQGACLVKGTKFGATYGVGFHSFFNDFVALNVELRDVLAPDNPAGKDVNGDTREDNNDLTWSSHVMAFVGVTLYLPATPSISD